MRFAYPLSLFVGASLLGDPLLVSARSNGEGDTEDSPKTIAEVTAESERFDGLFTLFRDRNSGETRLPSKPDQLGREYIYFAVGVDGVVQGAHFHGNFRADRIVSLHRSLDRIEFQFENSAFYFDPDSPLSRASTANIGPTLLHTQRRGNVETQARTQRLIYLIDRPLGGDT